MQRYPNPFSNTTLSYPLDQRKFYYQYCRPSSTSDVEASPFPRPVDLWFAGLSVAARKKLKPVGLTGQRWSGLERGITFDSDSWRVQIVMLVAIAVEDDVEVVADPNRMMAVANRLAAAGVPYVVQMLEEGGAEPIWNLSDALEQLLTEE